MLWNFQSLETPVTSDIYNAVEKRLTESAEDGGQHGLSGPLFWQSCGSRQVLRRRRHRPTSMWSALGTPAVPGRYPWQFSPHQDFDDISTAADIYTWLRTVLVVVASAVGGRAVIARGVLCSTMFYLPA